MISYYTPLLGPVHGREPNTSQFLGGSICSFFRRLWLYFELDFLGVTVGMIVTVGFLYNYGWWTGSAASHTKAIIARTKGIWMNTKSTE
jgi:hypothetical protein